MPIITVLTNYMSLSVLLIMNVCDHLFVTYVWHPWPCFPLNGIKKHLTGTDNTSWLPPEADPLPKHTTGGPDCLEMECHCWLQVGMQGMQTFRQSTSVLLLGSISCTVAKMCCQQFNIYIYIYTLYDSGALMPLAGKAGEWAGVGGGGMTKLSLVKQKQYAL